jgi:hypothetical protein
VLKLLTATALLTALLAAGSSAPAASLVRTAPAAVPNSGSYRPLANGDSFTYALAITRRVTRNGKTTKISYTGNSTTAVAYPATFKGQRKLYDLHKTSQTSNGNSSDEHFYVQVAQNGSLQLQQELGYTDAFMASNGSSSNLTLVDGQPLIDDELPETAGLSWERNVPYKESGTDGGPSYSDVFSQTSQADGSYVYKDKQTVSGQSTTYTEAENADGSGTLAVSGYPTTTFGLPFLQGSAYFIPVTVSSSSTTDVPDWFPGNASAPQPLAYDSDTIHRLVKTPKACGSMAGMTAYDVRDNFTDLDTISGSYVFGVLDYYDVAGMGTVCLVFSQDVSEYDNTTDGLRYYHLAYKDIEILTSETIHADRTRQQAGAAFPFRSAFGPAARMAFAPG